MPALIFRACRAADVFGRSLPAIGQGIWGWLLHLNQPRHENHQMASPTFHFGTQTRFSSSFLATDKKYDEDPSGVDPTIKGNPGLEKRQRVDLSCLYTRSWFLLFGCFLCFCENTHLQVKMAKEHDHTRIFLLSSWHSVSCISSFSERILNIFIIPKNLGH